MVSSGSEVLAIIALLQRQMYTETTNCTLKCLNKWHFSSVRSVKISSILIEGGALTLFFRPRGRGIWQLKCPSPPPPPKKKGGGGGGRRRKERQKRVYPGVSPWKEGMSAAGTDWCIILIKKKYRTFGFCMIWRNIMQISESVVHRGRPSSICKIR